VAKTVSSYSENPSPPFRGEREEPGAKRWEGEVGISEYSGIPHLTPTLSAPEGGEGDNRRLDPRLNAYRPDLADVRLRGAVAAPRYVEGRPARVVVGRAPVHRSPEPAAPLDTYYHYGDPVLVFDEAGGKAWCQSLVDDYVGYVEAKQVAIGGASAPTHFVATMGSYLYGEPDMKLPAVDFLPRHSAVVVAETKIVTRGSEYVRLDTGGFVPFGCLSAEPPRSPDIVAAAERYLGCPYLWGGKSFLGLDCSGLVQNAFRDIGITVLRDTDMQRDTIGEAAAIGSEGELRRGDLLYVPGHAMICAGDGGVVHADGATMTVRRQLLFEFIAARGFDLTSFVVRRHPAAVLTPAGSG
jgi:cell wall-associated NlpC family hydrolase